MYGCSALRVCRLHNAVACTGLKDRIEDTRAGFCVLMAQYGFLTDLNDEPVGIIYCSCSVIKALNIERDF
jgi:hypothetical protein